MSITEHERGTMRLFAARTGAKDLVTIEGSVLGGYHMLPQKLQMVPRLATELFDAGTSRKSKEEIRSSLTERGASIQFSPGGDRTHFHATCLPEDTGFVLKLVAECLTEAVFPTREISLQKRRTLAELEEMKTKTATLARQELFRTIYDRGHSNYSETIPESMTSVEGIGRSHLRTYQKMLGHGGLVIAITGDVLPEQVLEKAEQAFSSLPSGTQHMTEKRLSKVAPKSIEKRIFIEDKASIDVAMGAHVSFNYESAEFIPFIVVTSLLGGHGLSTGHLARTIRERDGLTYSIHANPVGFAGRADGALRISASFSPATYEKAIEATKREIGIFLKSGINEKAMLAKKAELAGRYAIGLGTSRGLANELHWIGIEGKPLSYIDEYPSIINALQVRDLKKVSSQISFDKLAIVSAGTFDKKR